MFARVQSEHTRSVFHRHNGKVGSDRDSDSAAEIGERVRLGTQERQRYDRHSVGPTICLRTCCDNHRVDEAIANSVFQPREMTYVLVVNHARQLDLNTEYPFLTFNDEINFMSASVFTHMEDLSAGSLRERSHRKGHK